MLLRSHPDDDAAPNPRPRIDVHIYTQIHAVRGLNRIFYATSIVSHALVVLACPEFDPSPFRMTTTTTTTTGRALALYRENPKSNRGVISDSSSLSQPIPRLLIRGTYRAVSRGRAGRRWTRRERFKFPGRRYRARTE